jgi:hypothetical protein
MVYKYFRFSVILLLMALLVTGCPAVTAPVAPVAATTLTIVARDHTYEVPQQISGGWVKIALKNEGPTSHHAQFVRLNDGVTMEQFLATLQENTAAVLSLVTLVGGPGVVDAGGMQETTVYLEPGNYLVFCILPDEAGVPHLAHGMIAPVQVTAPTGAPTPEPVADAEVQLVDFSFALPQAIQAGAQTWKVTVTGQQPHEMELVKLAQGKTVADLMAWMHEQAGAPPYASVGGMQAIEPGASGYLHLNLTPGEYVAICHVPDAASGKAHLELGMILPFSVE